LFFIFAGVGGLSLFGMFFVFVFLLKIRKKFLFCQCRGKNYEPQMNTDQHGYYSIHCEGAKTRSGSFDFVQYVSFLVHRWNIARINPDYQIPAQGGDDGDDN